MAIWPLIVYAGSPVTKNIALWFSLLVVPLQMFKLSSCLFQVLHYSNCMCLFYEKAYLELGTCETDDPRNVILQKMLKVSESMCCIIYCCLVVTCK